MALGRRDLAFEGTILVVKDDAEAGRHADRFERWLGIQLRNWIQVGDACIERTIMRQHEIGILRQSWYSIKVARK